jgi:hypothetical protein
MVSIAPTTEPSWGKISQRKDWGSLVRDIYLGRVTTPLFDGARALVP